MYNFTDFDSKILHWLSFVYSHLKALFFIGVIIIIAGIWFKAALALSLFIGIFCGGLYLFGGSVIPGNAFARRNNLSRPFLTRSSNYLFLYEEYKNVKQSALFKDGELVWGLPIHDSEFGLMFLSNGDVVAWARLQQNFPQLVIDATKNSRLIRDNIQKRKLPSQQLHLEGDFPKYFKVYAEADKQVLSLQILSPDLMATLIDKLEQFDFEIKGKHLKIYVVGAQKNQSSMRSLISVLETLAKDLKIERMNKIQIN